MPIANYTEPNAVESGDGTTQLPLDCKMDDNQETTLKIVTYVGSGVAVLGVILTLLSYIGYRKFHVKRPHIVMVNLCFCLFLYYLAYFISNPDRQSWESFDSHTCVFGAIVCHFALLASWFWILVYWILVLVMFRRPMGGHISHFFIKASFPSYGVPLIIIIVCTVVAQQKGELIKGEYFGTLLLVNLSEQDEDMYETAICFVDNMYLYLGAILPIILSFIPMLVIFVMLMKGVVCEKEERLKSSNTRRNIKRHFVRLTIITLLWATVTAAGFVHFQDDCRSFAATIVFGVISSILGVALMILFCLHHEEIRDHWMSVMRGESASMRKHSVSRGVKYEVGEQNSSRKSSTLKGNPPSMYIESYEEERRPSNYRIVAKEDTDMSTLGLIEIPGTPSPARPHDANDNPKDGKKVGRKKSDASKMKHLQKDGGPKSPKERSKGLGDILEMEGSGKSGKKKTRSSSSPPLSPSARMTKRQQTSDAILMSTSSPKNDSSEHTEKKRPSKRGGNPAHRLSRFARKSTSTIDEDTVQLTEL